MPVDTFYAFPVGGGWVRVLFTEGVLRGSWDYRKIFDHIIGIFQKLLLSDGLLLEGLHFNS